MFQSFFVVLSSKPLGLQHGAPVGGGNKLREKRSSFCRIVEQNENAVYIRCTLTQTNIAKNVYWYVIFSRNLRRNLF